MATSPNYAWAEPDNSSLVKNGAQDIRALGDAIDTSVWNVGYGQAGKNKIINGDMNIWQRGTSFSNPVTASYICDRFQIAYNGTGATRTITRETFTPAAAPVAGYEGQYFLRYARTVAGSGATFDRISQLIEDVRTFAGQTITVSFWAKANSGTPVLTIRAAQIFGGGGSADVNTDLGTATLSTSWARYSVTGAIPSISGKTIGTNSNLNIQLRTPVDTIQTFDIWGVQAEYGSYATPFQTASGGSPQAELAACQRYYWRAGGTTAYELAGQGTGQSTTVTGIQIPLPSTMRIIPTAVDYATLAVQPYGTGTITSVSSVAIDSVSSKNLVTVVATVASGLTQGQVYRLFTNNSTSGYIGLSAEL
jgi:hypothetical protein